MCPSDLCDDRQNQNDKSGGDKGGENHSDNPEERQETKEDIISGRDDSRQNDIRRGLRIVLFIMIIVISGERGFVLITWTWCYYYCCYYLVFETKPISNFRSDEMITWRSRSNIFPYTLITTTKQR